MTKEVKLRQRLKDAHEARRKIQVVGSRGRVLTIEVYIQYVHFLLASEET